MNWRKLRRMLCRHKFRKVGSTAFGNVYHCKRCNGIYADNFGKQGKLYIGEYEDFYDENGREF